MGVGETIFIVTFAVMTFGRNMVQGQDCPAIYKRFSADHSYCKPKNPTCAILATFVTPAEIALILKEHNNYRSKVASGNEPKLPSASNMLQMVWDDELAAVAQIRSLQCQFSHDTANARRVQNFGVGQNIAIETLSNSPTLPVSNWTSAIKSWYDELEFFSKNFIDPFVAPTSPTYGHFSQVVWADSWRVGCGYVLYQEDNVYKKLYVCNYGPLGNMIPDSMYKIGQPCTGCPINSCCDNTCGAAAEYPSLCKIMDGQAPTYESKESYLFYCDFKGQSDCAFSNTGLNLWKIYTTLSGNYMGIVLEGGQSSTITFLNTMKPTSSPFCFTINYRKGSDVDGQPDSNSASETVSIPSKNFQVSQSLPSFDGDQKQQFGSYGMGLSWSDETQVSVTFSVPNGAPAQFFEIQNVFAQDGDCKH